MKKATYTADYSNTFGRVDNTALALINSCKDIHKDKNGHYVYDAVSYDNKGVVTFSKRYL